MNTSQRGDIARAYVLAALLENGKEVWSPAGEGGRSDLGFREPAGRFFRVQCKMGWLAQGAVTFATCSIDSRSGETTIRRPYHGEVEFFGVYCEGTGKVYLVPVGDVPPTYGRLRVDPPRNNQRTRIRWAKDYEIASGKVELVIVP